MSPQQLKELFPNATPDFIKANCSPENPRKLAIVERHPGNATLEPSQAQRGDSTRFLVRVTAVRKRLIDEDNLCEKYHVDALRYCGILPSDAPDRTHIETSQRKTEKKEAPYTLIEVFEIT